MHFKKHQTSTQLNNQALALRNADSPSNLKLKINLSGSVAKPKPAATNTPAEVGSNDKPADDFMAKLTIEPKPEPELT